MTRIFRHWILIAVSFLVLSPLAAHAAQDDPASPAVTVLVYNPARVPKNVLHSAFEEAARIFRHAGVSTRWLDCSEAAVFACRQPMRPETLVLRIVPESEGVGNHDAFGVAYLSADGRATYSTVFYDRIERMRAEWRTSLASLLGHVAVHEIGHLLLGPNAHSPTGIMCAQWQARELQQLSRGNLLFNRDQSAWLRAGLQKRYQIAFIEGVSGAEVRTGH